LDWTKSRSAMNFMAEPDLGGVVVRRFRWRVRTQVMVLAWIALALGGLVCPDCLSATILLWIALVGGPFLVVRHPVFFLVWGYLVVVGYFVCFPFLVLTWMSVQHTFFGLGIC
jgi:hypothetical protein